MSLAKFLREKTEHWEEELLCAAIILNKAPAELRISNEAKEHINRLNMALGGLNEGLKRELALSAFFGEKMC